jgi:hypothetical protein
VRRNSLHEQTSDIQSAVLATAAYVIIAVPVLNTESQQRRTLEVCNTGPNLPHKAASTDVPC